MMRITQKNGNHNTDIKWGTEHKLNTWYKYGKYRRIKVYGTCSFLLNFPSTPWYLEETIQIIHWCTQN